MKLEINLPDFKTPILKRLNNVFSHQGVRALIIVLSAITLISVLVYLIDLIIR